jgi:putative DNA methylase
VPLASTFMLSTKAGKEAYVEPVIEGGSYRFTVKVGKPKDAELPDVGCANCPRLHRDEGKAGVWGLRLMAIVAEGTSAGVSISRRRRSRRKPPPMRRSTGMEA